MTVRGAGLRLGLFAGLMAVVLALVLAAIERPVSGDTHAHDALFTDANGLKTGDDVRMYGVQVGKVEAIGLDGDRAKVRITVRTDTPVYDNSKLAIRYQNLTGQRYIDLQQQPNPGVPLAPNTRIGTEMTVPSFDVTSLFNGLKPVLATLSPEAVNQFTESMLAVIEGDGTGIGPAMEAIGTLSRYAGDRQDVIATVVRNMAEIAEQVGGEVHHLVPLLARLSDIFESLRTNIGGLADFAMSAPSVLGPLDRLLGTLGLDQDGAAALDAQIRALFPDPQQAVEVFSRLPGLLQAVDNSLPRTVAGWKPACANGSADVPVPVQVLIAGQKVAICNA
ncbi:MCE family protein [Nocardia puris]|uniref:Phospholipid/cholesterol/gamma-HCH transport system substrate-binding protein n=1 Tax=Nocardia puris TaxID=208602 RepID=A0A366DBK5_9NOCA|nr:MCE family protein [Nocardia puris]MBF6214128.1 MCE family protein [Nocardia puris]MBF6368588.1 MCE family protein [Nocardia puris]MBF6461490.1 MCE family protein [Nocardia puris]RBO86638.1 phospholipid/cholesterol/gamma-HCH transport system substrate-binding protein [Nocardia puris]